MPSNRTKRARTRANAIDHWKLDQLVTGQCLLAGVGYGAGIPSGCNFWTREEWKAVHSAMRADWERHGRDIMAWWRGERDRYECGFTGRDKLQGSRDRKGETQPWAFLKWGEPQ